LILENYLIYLIAFAEKGVSSFAPTRLRTPSTALYPLPSLIRERFEPDPISSPSVTAVTARDGFAVDLGFLQT
jgi:hypothetical protein